MNAGEAARAAYWTVWTALDGNLTKVHGSRVKDQQCIGQELAEACKEFESFKCGEIGHSCRDGADHREFTFPSGRNLRIKASKAGGSTGNDSGELALHFKHRSIYKRFLLSYAFPVQKEPLFEEWCAVKDEISSRDKASDVFFSDVLSTGFDFYLGIQFHQSSAAGFDPWFSQLVMSLKDLSIKVAVLGVSSMSEDQFPESCCSQ